MSTSVEPVSSALEHGALTPGAGDVAALLASLPLGRLLGELAPVIRARRGPIAPGLVPRSCRTAVVANAPTWERLAATTIGELLGWPYVGFHRAGRVIAFVLAQTEADSVPPGPQTALRPMNAALQLVSAWAVTHGIPAGLDEALTRALADDAPPDVLAAAGILRSIDLRDVAGDFDLSRFDPIASAEMLLAEFDGRDLEILERTLALGLRPIETLAALGTRHGVTRERIRQLEVKVRQRLATLLETQRFAVIRRHADALSDEIGAAIPVDQLPAEMAPRLDNALVDELFGFLCGPYRLVDGWLLRHDLGESLNTVVGAAFDSFSEAAAAPVDAIIDALEGNGIRTEAAGRLIGEAKGFRVFADHVVRWDTIGQRVAGVLAADGQPMSTDELLSAIGGLGNERSVRNHLSVATYVKRIKKDVWALSQREGNEYRSIIQHMVDALATGPKQLSNLAADLAAAFGVSPISVTMYATMHPLFIEDAGMVRLRSLHEPYVASDSLELTAWCYVIDGAWSQLVVVDKDLLRGSGRGLSEAFGVHLGIHAGVSGSLQCGERTVRVGWSMKPHIGSLRWVAQQESLVEGDLLFIRRASPSKLDFRYVRRRELADASPADELRYRVGADSTDRPMQRWLGDALGLGGASTASFAQLRGRLVARGEHALVDLLDRAGS